MIRLPKRPVQDIKFLLFMSGKEPQLLELSREIFGNIPAVQYASEEKAVEMA